MCNNSTVRFSENYNSVKIPQWRIISKSEHLVINLISSLMYVK